MVNILTNLEGTDIRIHFVCMAKIVNHSQLMDELRRDNRVILTHGAFDLFHIGHLELLKQSKALGGKLIVGIDSDESVTAYKRKPIVSQKYRTNIVAYLDFVDYVLPLDRVLRKKDHDYFYLKLYSQLKPDVITYGENFHFESEIDVKCRLVGIANRRLKHDFSDVTTSTYIKGIAERFGGEGGEPLAHAHE